MHMLRTKIPSITIGLILIFLVGCYTSISDTKFKSTNEGRVSSSAVTTIDVQEIDVGSERDFQWSPTDETIFAFLPPYGNYITVYQLIDNQAKEIKKFKEGYYSSFRWSKSGTHIIAYEYADRYKTFPISLISLNIQTGKEDLLVSPTEKGIIYNEIEPCEISYSINQQLEDIHIPSCNSPAYYQPYTYFLNNPVGDSVFGSFDVYMSKDGKTEKIFDLPPLSRGEFTLFVVSPAGDLYWRNGSFFKITGEKLYDSPIKKSSYFAWSSDGRFIVYSKLVNDKCTKNQCVGELFIFSLVDGKETKIFGLQPIRLISGISLSKSDNYVAFFGDITQPSERFSTNRGVYIIKLVR